MATFSPRERLIAFAAKLQISPQDLEAAIGRSTKTVEEVVLMSDDDFEVWAAHSIKSLPDTPPDTQQGTFRGQNFQVGGPTIILKDCSFSNHHSNNLSNYSNRQT